MECTSLRPSARRSSLTSPYPATTTGPVTPRRRFSALDRSMVRARTQRRASPRDLRRDENWFDVPAPGDYDGSGHTELAVFRPSTAQWLRWDRAEAISSGPLVRRNSFDVPPQTSAGHSSARPDRRHEDVRAQPRAVGPACRRTTVPDADGPAGFPRHRHRCCRFRVEHDLPEPSSAVRPSPSLHSSSHRRPDRAIHRRPPEFPSR